jgi:LPXTG-motif cell wall-anchored protein
MPVQEVNVARTAARVLSGIVLILLGGLWILQGADVLRIRPILCVADCQPITGGSSTWLAIGIATLAVGLGLAALRRRRT